MKPTKYQEAVYAFVKGESGYRHEAAPVEIAWDQPLPDDDGPGGDGWSIDFRGKRNAVVEAVAGSGKTTTIVKTLDFLAGKPATVLTAAQLAAAKAGGSWDALFGRGGGGTATAGRAPKVLFVAFNRHIAEELQRRVPRNVTASTLNSVGWGVCRSAGRCELDRYKDENILKTLLVMDNEDERKIYYKTKGTVAKLIGLFKALVVRDELTLIERFEEIADRYDVPLPDVTPINPDFDIKKKVVEVWKKSVSVTRYMSFDDQVFQPIYQGWAIPTYDWVFGDECQDWSPLNIELVKQLGRGGRVVAVGDRFQSIYGFRGADPEAVPNIISELDAVVLPLSNCFRCPTGVIAAAREIVPHIEDPPGENPKGEGRVEWVSTPEFLADVRDGDFVLCRTTAPLVKRCLELIGKRRKAVVKGRDIGQGLIAFLEDLCPDPMTPIGDFIEKLGAYKAAQLERLARANRDAEAQAVEDRADTLEVLALGCDRTIDIRRRIDEVFSDTDSAGVTFCTVHRSKGLEAPRIFILRPDLMPHPKSKQPWQVQQEFNLKYVAITRSQGELFFVRKERDEK